MAVATYHKRKLYIPKEVENKLKLSDGDRAEIEVLDEGTFKVRLKRKSGMTAAEERLIDRMINKPFSGKLAARHFRRKDYYDES
ncbi:MAG TPA: hypothetical protein VFF30_01675 [Nitrososphaerales archaeon]|nr:hypothetical protein [Nitrososphaerales archaeon]